MERISRSGIPDYLLAFVIAFGALTLSAGQAKGADLPDFVLVDIILAPPPPQEEDNRSRIFLGATIRNDGADFRGEISIVCDFACRGHSRRYVGGMTLPNGLAKRREVTLGNRTPLDIEGCFFVSQREFTCSVDKNETVDEADESNNSLIKTLTTDK